MSFLTGPDPVRSKTRFATRAATREAPFDDLTALAAELFEVPICLVTLLVDGRLLIKSGFGLGANEIPSPQRFCPDASQGEDILEVEETLEDPGLAKHPLVTGPEKIRYYAGALLHTPEGLALGTFCLLDRRPRKLMPAQRKTLQLLARQVMVHLQHQQNATELELQNQDLNETARIAQVGKWRSDVATGGLEWTGIVHEIFGIDAREFGGDLHSLLEAVHPADRAAMTAAQNQTLLGIPLDLEHRIVRLDGSIRWVHERGELVKDAGAPIYVAGTVQDITQRKSLSRDLEILFEISNDLICIASMDGHFERVNPAFESTLGWSRDELLSKPFEEFIVTEDRERTKKEFERFDMAGGSSTHRFESRFLTRDGQIRILAWASVAIPEEYTTYGIARDVTDERALERLVKQSSERMQETLESITDAFFAVDRAWRIVFLNSQGGLLLGRERETLLNRNMWDEYPAAVGGVFYGHYQRAMTFGEPVHFEEFYEPVGKWLEVRVFPSAQGLNIYLRDITEQKRAGEHLRLLETCVSHLNDFVLITEVDPLDEPGPRVVFVNDAFIRRTGYAREEVLGKSPRFMQGPKTSRAELELVRAALAKREPVRVEVVNYTKAGQEFWVELDLVPVADETGAWTHFVAIERDITARKMADEELRANSERYQMLFDSNPLPLWVYDVETLRFLSVNDAAVCKYGYSREEFLALTIRDIRPPEDIPALENMVAANAVGPRNLGTWKHLAKDGRLLTVEVHTHLVRFAERAASLVLPLDITDNIRLEEQLRQAQKMETIGRFAGGIAHDFNNLLTVINGYSQMLLNRASPRDQEDDQVRIQRRILNAGERASALTAQLLAFSRQQVLQPKTVAISQILNTMEPTLKSLIREDIEIVWKVSDEIFLVNLDPSQFEQVILNLTVNARDAMPDGGCLVIETGSAYLDETYCGVHADVAPGLYSMVSVRDDGRGMSPETLRRIFDPFFTTKEIGSGTGLGLATVYGIIKQSGGHISVYSELGLGTEFKAYFPVVDGEISALRQELDDLSELSGEGTVLLVEDDDAVREFASRILRACGYEVLECGNGPEAIVEAERFARSIDLLLTDVVLPKLNGRDLAEFISRRHPGIKVLFTSGYTENAILQQGVLEPGLNFLPKPFSAAALGQKVKVVLAAAVRQKTILILDDEAGVRDLFHEALQEAGYLTVRCANGRDAVRHLQDQPVDLLLTDLVMPDQEGIETIRQARRDFPHLKILAISGYAGGDYLKLARALGADETLAKPVQLTELSECVRSMIGR